jgi:hypothetical protein
MHKVCAIFCVLGFFLLSSCTIQTRPTGYCRLTQNVPLLKSKNEFQGMVTIAPNHAEEQFSFSPLKNIGLIGNLYQRFGDGESSKALEAGAGYYKLLKDSFEIEAYGIYTYSANRAPSFGENLSQPTIIFFPSGWSEQDTVVQHNLKANYDAASLQLNLGKHFKLIEFALCLRYSLLSYREFYDRQKIFYGSHGTVDTTIYLSTKYQSIITLAPTFKIGNKHFKYFAQLGYNFNLTNSAISKSSQNFMSNILVTNGLVIKFNIGKI